MPQTTIAQGAEAKLFKSEKSVIKNRIPKGYRLQILDERLRKQRTKREAKILEKAHKLIPVPKLIKSDEKNKKIEIEFIDGLKLSNNLNSLDNNLKLCKTIGQQIALLHDNNIIHGDLTTSNMIYVPLNKLSSKPKALSHKLLNNAAQVSITDNPSHMNFKVYFIDFGLSFESSKAEDKAVDLHLIKQALEAKHFAHYESFWKAILEGYKLSKTSKETLKRLEAVEKRGRYKQAY
jgi:TP53 regulating kinase-like protein